MRANVGFARKSLNVDCGLQSLKAVILVDCLNVDPHDKPLRRVAAFGSSSFVKICKSSSDSLGIVVKINSGFHFRFYELVSGKPDQNLGSKIDGIRDKQVR